VPITNISLGTLPPERLKNASGLFNLTRNLGGAVGLAGLNTVLDKRIDLHWRGYTIPSPGRAAPFSKRSPALPRASRARARKTWR
jgi:hypothetical protein